jgi:hypothetical protein
MELDKKIRVNVRGGGSDPIYGAFIDRLKLRSIDERLQHLPDRSHGRSEDVAAHVASAVRSSGVDQGHPDVDGSVMAGKLIALAEGRKKHAFIASTYR